MVKFGQSMKRLYMVAALRAHTAGHDSRVGLLFSFKDG